MESPEIQWELGTAYDLFISLEALHDPARFGIRKARAVGMRARVGQGEREILDLGSGIVGVPLRWIHSLPSPRDAETALWHLGQIAPKDRLAALCFCSGDCAPYEDLGREVLGRGSWDQSHLDRLRAIYEAEGEVPPPRDRLRTTLDWFAKAEEFGARFLEALRTYCRVFFFEEERRIRPFIETALETARAKAAGKPLDALLEDLSQGVRMEHLDLRGTVILVPSFWCTPLLFIGHWEDNFTLYIYGARPADASLTGEEDVPEALLRALEALADPTRLRILNYLGTELLSPSQLAKRLRLRAPTVTHHLGLLRSAGLVQVSYAGGKDKEKKRYASRPEAIDANFEALMSFIGGGRGRSDG